MPSRTKIDILTGRRFKVDVNYRQGRASLFVFFNESGAHITLMMQVFYWRVSLMQSIKQIQICLLFVILFFVGSSIKRNTLASCWRSLRGKHPNLFEKLNGLPSLFYCYIILHFKRKSFLNRTESWEMGAFSGWYASEGEGGGYCRDERSINTGYNMGKCG